ncbi:MAG: HDOD domain-containing protein [bacterium]
MKEIPTLPIIYQELFKLMQDPNVTIADLADIISNDQALTAKLLRLVNSAYYGYQREIQTISRALVVLGFRAIRNAALALSIFDQFSGEESDSHLNIVKFWEHSVTVASICKVLAEKVTPNLAEEAFVIGLLHDTGKLIMKKYFPADFDTLTHHLAADEKCWIEGEKELFPVNHATIGKTVFRAWDFPASVVEAIQFHHDSIDASSHPQLISLLQVSNSISYHLEMGSPLSHGPTPIDPDVFDILGITPDFALALVETYKIEVKQSMEILNLMG